MLRLKTVPPLALEVDGEKKSEGGAERIALSLGRRPVLGLSGRATPSGHMWFIEEGEEGTPRNLTELSVFEEEELMLRYDSRTGLAELIRSTPSATCSEPTASTSRVDPAWRSRSSQIRSGELISPEER